MEDLAVRGPVGVGGEGHHRERGKRPGGVAAGPGPAVEGHSAGVGALDKRAVVCWAVLRLVQR